MNKKELQDRANHLKAELQYSQSKRNEYDIQYKVCEDEIKRIEKELEEYGKPWKPETGKPYYVPILSCFGFSGGRCIWRGTEFDRTLLKAGYACQTEEEATGKSKQIYFKMWFENLGDVTEEMWEDDRIPKHYAFWDCEERKLHFKFTWMSKAEGTTYFTSGKKLKEAIDTIGDNFYKYVLGAIL